MSEQPVGPIQVISQTGIPKALQEIAQRVQAVARKVQAFHVIYNNNASDYAPRAALRFKEILGQATAKPPVRPVQESWSL